MKIVTNFVMGMLKTFNTLPLDRIHSMLSQVRTKREKEERERENMKTIFVLQLIVLVILLLLFCCSQFQFASDTYTWTIQELSQFLNNLVNLEQLQCAGGLYSIKK